MNILIAGDYCSKYRVAEKIALGKYHEMFGDIKPLVENADYSIVNFEFPIVAGNGKPITKCGPCLKGTPESIEAIKYAGFNCCTLANNHTLDYGEQCGLDTMHRIEDAGMDNVGFGENEELAASILYKEINGETLAVINCCEHEFSIATPTTAGTNALNPIRQYHAINEARRHADYVVVIVHGGHEHFQLPSPRMQETYRFFIDAGADAVVNHHQHCYSGYEVYNGKPIFYGLGNLLFDGKMRHSIWNEGYMVSLNLNHDKVTFTIHPYSQCNEQPCVTLLPQSAFDERIKELNSIISDENRLRQVVEKYYSSSARGILSFLEPFASRIYNGLRHRGLVPSFISKGRKIRAINYICCEAHRDKLVYGLTH